MKRKPEVDNDGVVSDGSDLGVRNAALHSFYVQHSRVHPDLSGHSMTRQEFRDECDINVLMAHYDKAGVWPMAPEGVVPEYLDLSDVPDFQAAMNLMLQAEKAFMTLPATVRREFDNDPGKFVSFAEDPAHLGQMREWGLAPPEPAPEAPARVEVVNPPWQGDKTTDEPPKGKARRE